MNPTSLRYLQLLKRTLTGYHENPKSEYFPLAKLRKTWKIRLLLPLDGILRLRNFRIVKERNYEAYKRLNGYDWPSQAITMIGMNRLDHLQTCMLEVLKKQIAGDFVEAGVWRGGCIAFMRAVLRELDIKDRKVWALDSFQGLPAPDTTKHPMDKGFTLHQEPLLCVPIEEVKANLDTYGLLDEQVFFLQGWFRDTLPNAPISSISILRIDADMYESTWEVLLHLYPKLSHGGIVIVDDYNAFRACKSAVDKYREENQIMEEIIPIDKEAIYWTKS